MRHEACVEISMVSDPREHELGLNHVKTQMPDVFIGRCFTLVMYPSIWVGLEDVRQELDNVNVMVEQGKENQCSVLFFCNASGWLRKYTYLVSWSGPPLTTFLRNGGIRHL